MVVIGRGDGEILHDADASVESQPVAQYADNDIVLHLATRIAESNAELMRRLA